MDLPSITLHDFSTHTPFNVLATHLAAYPQFADDGQDTFITDNSPSHDSTDLSIHNHTDFSIYDSDPPDYSDSDMSPHLPPSTNAPTEASSAAASDSDLPHSPLHPPKPPRQTGLLNFFSTVPADEVHAVWGKRKRDNRERDEEKCAKIVRQEEEWRAEKRQKRRDENRAAQQKHRTKVKSQVQKPGVHGENGMSLPVSETFTSNTANS
jgi:hypothetical protein